MSGAIVGGAFVAFLLATATTPCFAQGPGSYGRQHVFDVFRKGDRIGSHRLTFSRVGEDTIVDIAIELRVTLGGILTVYRYRHEGRETWRDGRVVELATRTDDNGRAWSVRASAGSGGLRVRANRPDGSTAGNAEAPIAGNAVEATVAADAMPTSHWNRAWLERARILNTQSGEMIGVSIEPTGEDRVATSCGPRRAVGYRIEGELRKDVWFDEAGRWAKSAFDASDGSRIEYVLRCETTDPAR